MWDWLAALPSDPNPWAQLGISSIVVALLSGALSIVWKKLGRTEEEVKLLQLARVEDAQNAIRRERELADRLGPLLANAAEVLSTVPARFDQALSQAQSSTRTSEVDQLMQRLETTVRNIDRDRGGP